MAGEPSFFEIGVPDAKRARSFYSQVFDWTFHAWPDSDMSWIETPGAASQASRTPWPATRRAPARSSE
jgi:predicted enzyme related to lactoylglutathione lyase